MHIQYMIKYTPTNYPEFLKQTNDYCHLSKGLVVWNKSINSIDLVLGKIHQDDGTALTLESGNTDMSQLVPFDPNSIFINEVSCNATLKEEVIELLEDQKELMYQVSNAMDNGDLTLLHEIINRLDTQSLKEIL
jgi:hypothetical protein